MGRAGYREDRCAGKPGRRGRNVLTQTRTPARRMSLLPAMCRGRCCSSVFAFAVMADPVSSVAYTIEASLRALNGYLGLLMATQVIVLGIILLVDVNYWQ